MTIFTLLSIIFLSLCIGYYLYNLRNKRKERIRAKATPASVEIETPLEKKIMFEETITIIRQLSESISSPLNLNELGKEIVKTTCKILGVEICALLLLDETTDTLSVLTSIGMDDTFASIIRIRKGEEISGLVAKYNEVKIINDLERKEQAYNLKYDRCYKNTLVSLPLSVKNNVLGVLNVSSRKTGAPFSPADAEILQVIALESAIALQNYRLIQAQHKIYLDTIIALASALDARDPYTYWHSKNVTKYAVRIAQEMQLPSGDIEDIRYAGLLHDIGKIGIKDAVLMKPAKLTDEEYLQIKMHSFKGEEIIQSLPFLQRVAKIVRHHHERFDGKGYPDGIKGENIELGARILALVDSFDAMTAKRLYRDSLSLEEAKNELIKNKSTQFDPSIVDYFLQILKKEPHIIKA